MKTIMSATMHSLTEEARHNDVLVVLIVTPKGQYFKATLPPELVEDAPDEIVGAHLIRMYKASIESLDATNSSTADKR